LSGSKSFFQEAYRECECFWAQVRGVPSALWRADNTIGAYEGSFEECRLYFFKGRHDHGKQERARPHIPLVQSKHERVQRFAERGAEVLAQCTLLQRSACGGRHWSNGERAEQHGCVRETT